MGKRGVHCSLASAQPPSSPHTHTYLLNASVRRAHTPNSECMLCAAQRAPRVAPPHSKQWGKGGASRWSRFRVGVARTLSLLMIVCVRVCVHTTRRPISLRALSCPGRGRQERESHKLSLLPASRLFCFSPGPTADCPHVLWHLSFHEERACVRSWRVQAVCVRGSQHPDMLPKAARAPGARLVGLEPPFRFRVLLGTTGMSR